MNYVQLPPLIPTQENDPDAKKCGAYALSFPILTPFDQLDTDDEKKKTIYIPKQSLVNSSGNETGTDEKPISVNGTLLTMILTELRILNIMINEGLFTVSERFDLDSMRNEFINVDAS
jgi:hypothetical protein